MHKKIEKFVKRMHVQKPFELRNAYSELDTDQKRIKYSLNIMNLHNLIPETTGMPKNADESEKLREEGDKLFSEARNNTEYIKALKSYTKSIAFAPYPSEQLAFAYAKRSTVLFILGLWSECVQDIDAVLQLVYPEDLKFDLCMRKAECLIYLEKCYEELKECLQRAQRLMLKKITSSNLKKEKKRLKLFKLYCNIIQPLIDDSTSAKIKKSENVELPTILSYNTEVPCASDAVAINYNNNNYGRHVVATRDIQPGEVIAVEKPYTSILLQDLMQTHCSNCLKVYWANIPCERCTYAMYCSEKCRDDEWEKCHKVECDVFPALVENECFITNFTSVRMAVLALREAEGDMKKLIDTINTLDKYNNDQRTSNFSQDGKLHSDKYAGVHNLITHTESRDIDDIIKFSMATCFSLYFLATRTEIFGAKLSKNLSELMENNDVTFFGGLILRHRQILSENMHSV